MKSFLEYLFEAKSKSGSVDPEKTIHEFLTAVVLVNKKLLDITTLNSQNFKVFCDELEGNKDNKINLNNIIIGIDSSDNSINSYKNYFLTNAYKDQKKGAKKIDQKKGAKKIDQKNDVLKINKNIFGVLARAISAAQAIVNTYGILQDKIENVYLTGNNWHDDIIVYKDIAEDPLINKYGVKDFNSSDIVLIATTQDGNKEAFGISLKHAENINERPTVLNASVYKALNNITIDDSKDLGEDLKNAVKNWFITTVKANLKVLVDDIPDTTWELALSKSKEDISAKLSSMNDKTTDVKTFANIFNGILMNNTVIDKGQYKGKRIKEHTRDIINSLLGRKNSCFTEIIKTCQQYSDAVAEMLIALIFRPSLSKLKNISSDEVKKIVSGLNKYKDKELLNFNFALVTGIESQTNVSEAEAKEKPIEIKPIEIIPGTCETAEQFNSILAKITPDNGKNKDYRFILTPYEKSSIPATDAAAKNDSNPAKVYLDLIWTDENNQKITVANLNIRYKGSYTPSPQFQGTISDEFLKLLSGKEKLSDKEK